MKLKEKVAFGVSECVSYFFICYGWFYNNKAVLDAGIVLFIITLIWFFYILFSNIKKGVR